MQSDRPVQDQYKSAQTLKRPVPGIKRSSWVILQSMTKIAGEVFRTPPKIGKRCRFLKSPLELTEMIQSPSSRREEVVRSLIRQIHDDGLTAGDRMPSIRHLSSQLGIGVNAVRDAMMQAQTLGLIKIRPRSGAFVQSISYAPLVDVLAGTLEASLLQVDQNLLHLLEARQIIEVELASLAAQRRRLEDLLPLRVCLDAMATAANEENCLHFGEAEMSFHLGVARIARNTVLLTTLQAILALVRPYLAQLPWKAECESRTDRAHTEIYQALLAGDSEHAGNCMRDHLKCAYESLLARVCDVATESPAA